MSIILINASPKKQASNSSLLLDDLKDVFFDTSKIKELSINQPFLTEEEIKELQNHSTWVFVQPLYIDAIPSHLLSCFCQLEQTCFSDKKIHVYAVVNGGHYEGKQSHHALGIMENWCKRAGLQWGMGIGFGGSGALDQIDGVPIGYGPKKRLGKAYEIFVDAILSQSSKENIYVSVGLPRFVYKLLGELGWRKQIRSNGGRWKDLKRRV